jgi:hypothetical protein
MQGTAQIVQEDAEAEEHSHIDIRISDGVIQEWE